MIEETRQTNQSAVGCSLVKNGSGKYDLTIKNGNIIIETVKDLDFQTAVVILENRMYCSEHDSMEI